MPRSSSSSSSPAPRSPRPRLSLAVGAGLVVTALTGCALPGAGGDTALDPVRVTTPPGPSWSYGGDAGPERWGSLSSAWQTCATGTRQSPVDLAPAVAPTPAPDDAPAGTVDLAWGPVELDVDDEGHGAHLETEGPAAVVVDGERRELVQFHAHAPSEHVVDGRHASGEVHFVHRADDGSLTVVGLLVQVGDDAPEWAGVVAAVRDEVPQPRASGDDGPLSSLVSATTETGARIDPRGGGSRPRVDTLDAGPGDAAVVDTDVIDAHVLDTDVPDDAVDLAALLPASLDHVRYDGSLTTPPCTEGVTWLVLSTPVTMGAEQLAVLAGGGDTARPVQELGDRLVEGSVPTL